MTIGGGVNDSGTIYKIKPDGSGYKKLWDFAGYPNDGSVPLYCTLISDGIFLYGVTGRGGINGMGTIYKIKPDGSSYKKLWDFTGAPNDGHEPNWFSFL